MKMLLVNAAASKRAKGSGDEGRWRAVVRKDRSADGKFYYAVRTTGVYCRPSCPARRPRRRNVEFHASAAAAEKAGFRPCRRCDPRDAGRVRQRQAALVAAACRAIEAAVDEAPRLGALAASAGMSPSHFHRLFKAATGLTPKAYAAARRGDRVRRELRRRGSVTEAIYQAGFNSNGRFYAQASRLLGMKPKAYRDGGSGAVIRFAVGACSLGAILVAASERGVCAILIGDDPDALARDLQDHFPQAELIGGDRSFEKTVARVVGFVDAPQGKRRLDLPLDIRGTAFQERVWQALRGIPAGSTATYAQIARRIGLPRAVRAVARACGANPLAVAIPCHRVVRADGSLSGYRWGVERKRALLQRERA